MISRIEIEGIDKTGKDTLVGYIDYMSGRSIPVGSRGILSTLAYNLIYDRNNTKNYDRLCEDNKNTLIVLLTADTEDLEIRYKITHEPKIDMTKQWAIFEGLARGLENHNGINVVRYNTTYMTPYQIAQEIIELLEKENGWVC